MRSGSDNDMRGNENVNLKLFTDERAEFNAAVKVRRETWLRLHPLCWFCDLNPSTGVHEIGTEGNRRAFLDEPCSWGAACSRCNCDELTNYRKWPIIRQLAMKLIYDPENVDLERYNRIRHRGPRAITMAELLLVKAKLVEELCLNLEG